MPAQPTLPPPSRMAGVSLHRTLTTTLTLHTSPALVLPLLAGDSRRKAGLQAQLGIQSTCCINRLNTASHTKQLPPLPVKVSDLHNHTETAEGPLPRVRPQPQLSASDLEACF